MEAVVDNLMRIYKIDRETAAKVKLLEIIHKLKENKYAPENVMAQYGLNKDMLVHFREF
jgi:hypothetical protein